MNSDFSDMLSALSAEGVEYLLIGAYAMAVHGFPRATGDIDVWVRPSPDNADRVIRALTRFGAPLGELQAADLAGEGTVFQIGVAPNRVDVMTAIDGVTFDEAWPRRHTRTIEGVTLSVISRDDLIRNKRATGRARDRVDAEQLEEIR
jgi:hypothetical protein